MRSIPPGERGNIIVMLRRLMTAYDSASFVLDGDLSEIDTAAESLASTLRPQIEDTANGIFQLLEILES